MLNNDALSQLRGLKDQMESEKERTEAVLRGTARATASRAPMTAARSFVPPDEMLKAFPGDRVRVCIKPGKDKRPVAEVEGAGQQSRWGIHRALREQGQGDVRQPDLPGFSRWLFLPPQARNGAKPATTCAARCCATRSATANRRPRCSNASAPPTIPASRTA
jgi:hypothetical protein